MTSESSERLIADLVNAAAQGDADAFGALYRIYFDRIYRYILFKVTRPDDAEDLAAHVFLNAWKGIQRFEWKGRPFAAWLFRLAHNMVIDHYRRSREQTDLDPALGLEDESQNLEQIVEDQVTMAEVREALHQLTSEQQQVIILKFINNLENREIATIMGKNEGTIRGLQFRALGALRRILRKEG